MDGSHSSNEPSIPAEDSSSPGASERRWTCEACGCNTNLVSDRRCTICGTSQNNGSSILRRAGYAARVSGLLGRRNNLNNNDDEHHLPFGNGLLMDGYYHEFFESVMDGDVDMNAVAAADEDDDNEIAAMAMEIAGNSARTRTAAAIRTVVAGGTLPARSIVDATRSFAMSAREPVPKLEPEELLKAARDNDSYQPKWMNPSLIGGRMRTGNGIEIGDGADQNVAYLPLGSGEGRALRALEAFPRGAPFASFSLSSSSTSTSIDNASVQQRNRHKRVFGFKVAFAHPSKEDGKNMGGSYLIGVTTTSFSAFSEKNALQQSPFFFGIDDGGNKYEGSRNNSAREGPRTRRKFTYAVELREDEAARNDDGVIFGSKDIITCVVDMESRTLTFWRGEKEELKLLGTLIKNIPRSGQLYPIVVPYNAGATVSITGMSGEPLPLLSSFAISWKLAKFEKETQLREKLKAEYLVFFRNKSLTPELTSALQEIFSQYTATGETTLTQIKASRLWYRCGLKISSLKDIFCDDISTITFEYFYRLLERIVADDAKHFPSDEAAVPLDFQIGEKVELVSGYERFGDAVNGPLLSGNRGTIIELQGAKGLRHSIRVLYNSRRWWYQPQSLVRENSGLTDSPGIWFMKGLLRSHGYDSKTLQLMVGKQVSATSWEVGDLVVPKKLKNASNIEQPLTYGINQAIGRITSESSVSGPLSTRGRISGSVSVEFISKTFAQSTSVQVGSPMKDKPFALECRKISTSRIVHTSAFHGLSASQKHRTSRGTGSSRVKAQDTEDKSNIMDLDNAGNTNAINPVSDCVMSDFQMMKILDAAATERVVKECVKSSTSLIDLFEAGLLNVVLESMDCVIQNIQLSDEQHLVHAVSALGKLALLITQKCFPDDCCVSSSSGGCGEHEELQQSNKSQQLHSTNDTSNLSNDQLDAFRPGADTDLSADMSNDRITRSSSLMQRRRMLLSLMSRARRSEGDPLGDILSREMHAMPSLEMSADAAAALFFAPPNDINASLVDDGGHRDDGRLENSRPIDSTNSSEITASAKHSFEVNVLEILMRGRKDELPSKGIEERCIVPPSSMKTIASLGILGNSSPWLKSLLCWSVKKYPRQPNARDSSILKFAFDDDGMPLLQLAITLGCSDPVIRELIRFGAPVTEKEIQLAAELDLPDALSTLLLHEIYVDGMVDLGNCSVAVASVIHEAKKRQCRQNTKVRREADSFLVSFTRKLIQVCLKRRQQQFLNDTLGRAIACALVGNVELYALRRRHKVVCSLASSVSSVENQEDIDSVESERPTLGEPCGLLQALPIFILGRSLAEDSFELTNLLLIVEDCLSSKGIHDGCVGLTILLTILQRFPPLKQSLEMERYGFADFVSSHDALALNQLTEISARVSRKNLNKKSTEEDLFSKLEVIRCPKNHTSGLHVTKHSSFRCDLCGNGVEFGAVMFGCRECDWDICESCTDKREGGIMKWKFVKELATRCQEHLGKSMISDGESTAKEDEITWGKRMVEALKTMDNASEVNTLSIKILQRDPDSIQRLAFMLGEKGKITLHQFLNIVLPALHTSLMGRSTFCSERAIKGRRTKKPRQEERMESNEEERLAFAKEILKYLACDKSPKGSNDPNCPTDEDQGNVDMQDDDDDDDDYDGGYDGFEEEHEVTNENTKATGKQLPHLFRLLHKSLTLHEDVRTIHVTRKDGSFSNELRSLKKPLKIQLVQEGTNLGRARKRIKHQHVGVVIHMEPLVSIDDLSRQILKTASSSLDEYINFCRKLVHDSGIILVRTNAYSDDNNKQLWRIAKIISFNESGGWHVVRFASGFVDKSISIDFINFGGLEKDPSLEWLHETSNLILSIKKYVIIHRDEISERKSAFDMEQLLVEGVQVVGENKNDSKNVIGTLVESDFNSSSWNTYTVVSTDSSDEIAYDLVNDEGEVISGVPDKNISHAKQNDNTEDRSRLNPDNRRGVESRGQWSRAFPFISLRQTIEERPHPTGREQIKKKGKRVLKRTWSALASIESMCPVGLNVKLSGHNPPSSDAVKFACNLDSCNIDIYVDQTSLEFPPYLSVQFNSPHTVSPANISTQDDSTLISLLYKLSQDEEYNFVRDEPHQIFYSVNVRSFIGEKSFDHTPTQKISKEKKLKLTMISNDFLISKEPTAIDDPAQKQYTFSTLTRNRSRKLSLAANYPNENELGARCNGLDEICVQCIEIIEFLAKEHSKLREDNMVFNNGSIFVNQVLSQKLIKQTEDPLFVVGEIVPEWCFVVPTCAPNIFSYSSRKLLLDSMAYGISRSTLKQQDVKVKVGRLRQRMTSFRARAVELMADAFSGDVEDPTALQLQADELYGMEEALATRVRASFRAEGWEEMSLQKAKAAIHRESLLSDAIQVMNEYCSDPRLNRRRLEIRFDGESGFDAASGDEAGVTRGFYADLAESLLSCDLVSGVNCSINCISEFNNLPKKLPTLSSDHPEIPFKLPLWIPDTDTSGQVIIPTPRAAPSSIPGIFPRPISSQHPQLSFVLRYYRFMGRLFAAAMRDGFMFPLPLSASFLKLVQLSGNDCLQHFDSGLSFVKCTDDSNQGKYILSSDDLPRPGFLGGEVYATEMFICRALDRLNDTESQLSNREKERRYVEIAADKSFARIALGKNYDCSFAEYFENRTFVDPFDPTQGIEAHALCRNGYDRRVTIHNIREWVTKAKYFILHEGVVGQALAFKAGIDDFFPSEYLRLFTSGELQKDVCGMGDNVDSWDEGQILELFQLQGGKDAKDAEALVAVAAIGGNTESLGRRFDPSSNTIKWVVKALVEAEPQKRRRFLSFVTSLPIVTPGLIEIVPITSSSGTFLAFEDPGCLPRANTCSRRLYLPRFDSYDSFAQVLWAVVNAESKHKGFFEWQG